MRGRLLFLCLLLALFNVPAVAQIGLVVQLPPTANIAAVALHANGAVVDVIPEANQFLLSVPAAPSHLADTDVRWMELNQGATLPSAPHARYLQVAPNTAPGWYKTQPALALTNLGGALTYSTGRGVVVADINSRVDTSHWALIGHLLPEQDFVSVRPNGVTALNESSASYLDESSASYLDQSSASYLDESSASYLDESSASYLDGRNPAYAHGTLVAGILTVVAPGAMIWPLRAFDDNGSSDTWMIAKAIRYAVNHGAQVINLSLGSEVNSAVLRSAVDYALDHNVTVTASAGNKNSFAPQYPAGYSGVIAAAATNLLDVKAPFSNFGADVSFTAPGVNIISAAPGNLYAIVNGTSYAAPIIAGTAALLREQASTGVASRIAVINIDAKNPLYAGQLGRGRVNILKSVQPQ
ncbi:MAG: hypothetical protein DMG13_09100 [Acidobacteria bacterium]|nr:MAG: hypothetical protein DMG13_09100 [Acidobacteriota bacterium]